MGSSRLSKTVSRGSNIAGAEVRVQYVAPDELKPALRQVRHRTLTQTKRLARSISEFGFLVPILVDQGMHIVAGHGRWEAAKLLELTSLPIIRVEHLTEAQLRLFSIADNKLPEGVRWDSDALRIELAEIELLAPELDLSSSGFEIAEIDTLYGRARTDELSDLDEPVAVTADEPVNHVGDVWKLGRHMLGCGDARDAELIANLVAGRQVRALVSDPPWNLKIKGLVSGKGKVKHDDFVMAAGEMSKASFVGLLTDFLAAAQPCLIDGALLFIFIDWRNLDALTAATVTRNLEQKNLLVWCKANAGLGSLYRSRHELIGLYKHGEEPHTNNIQLGRYGRNRSNILFYPGVNSFGKEREAALATHPTCKPISLLADLLLDASAPGELILDPFGGSGATLIAAEKTGRTACLTELDPRYADAIVRRFEKVNGRAAIHTDSGLSFAEVAARRATDAVQGEKEGG